MTDSTKKRKRASRTKHGNIVRSRVGEAEWEEQETSKGRRLRQVSRDPSPVVEVADQPRVTLGSTSNHGADDGLNVNSQTMRDGLEQEYDYTIPQGYSTQGKVSLAPRLIHLN